jgi:hypothetical protein
MTKLSCYSSIADECFENIPCIVEKIRKDGTMIVAVVGGRKHPGTGTIVAGIVKYRAWMRDTNPCDLVCGEKSPTPDPIGAYSDGRWPRLPVSGDCGPKGGAC